MLSSKRGSRLLFHYIQLFLTNTRTKVVIHRKERYYCMYLREINVIDFKALIETLGILIETNLMM